MKHRFCGILPVLSIIAVTLSGCGYGSLTEVVKPTEVTVEHALADIGRGLGAMRSGMRAGGVESAGLLVDEVSITLNVTADANRQGKFVLDASVPVATTGSAKANSETGYNDNAKRSNQITIKFKNWYTAQLNSQADEVKKPDILLDDPTKLAH